MCQQCWSGNHGAPIVNTEEVLVTAELIRRLYEDLGCPTGGPLHWMLDDMNIDDQQVENADIDKVCEYLFDGSFERWAQAGDDTSDERKNAIKETCALILHAFGQMPESHRAAAIAWHEGWIAATFANLTDALENAGSLPRATPELTELTELLVADWTREMNVPPSQPGGTKACVPIPCPPFPGALTWDPGAKVASPDVVQVDSWTNVTWERDLVSRFLSVEPDADSISVTWGHPTEVGPDVPPRLRFPNARCPIEPLHLVHTWGDPPHWCDAQPLPDADRIEPS